MTLEEWEAARFYVVLIGSICTVSALLISTYISMKKPRIQTRV